MRLLYGLCLSHKLWHADDESEEEEEEEEDDSSDDEDSEDIEVRCGPHAALTFALTL